MNRLYAALRRRPVRAYLYGLLFPAGAVATYYGLVTSNEAALWITLGGAVLVIGGAEAAQTKTTPLADPRDADGDAAYLAKDYPLDPPTE